MRFDDALNRGLTGGRTQRPTVRSSIGDAERALGSKRAIADRLGVSVRTVQRWAAGQAKPRRGNADRLGELHRSRDVRSQLAPGKRGKLTRRGGQAKIRGFQGPVRGPAGGGSDYRRIREVLLDLDADLLAELYERWESGDEGGAREALAEWMEDQGYPSWMWGEIDEFTIR